MTVTTRLPIYFDFLINDFSRGSMSRHVHLGQWDVTDPGSTMSAIDFSDAQVALDQALVGMASLRDGMDILDVGCGFGGTIERLNTNWPRLRITGLNLDLRQLAICRTLRPSAENALSWTCGDAVSLPLRSQSFDAIFCIEAMPHFASRFAFLDEVARTLRPGGQAIVSDILIHESAANYLGMTPSALWRAFDDGLGPWPSLTDTLDDVLDHATSVGLMATTVVDASASTAPSHRHTVPSIQLKPDDPRLPYLRGANLLRRLHENGLVSYPYLRFKKVG